MSIAITVYLTGYFVGLAMAWLDDGVGVFAWKDAVAWLAWPLILPFAALAVLRTR